VRADVVVGRVAAPYGVKGWIRVVPFTGAPDALLGFATWRMTVRGEREPRAFRVLQGRVHGDAVVAAVEGVQTREQAALLRGATVAVPRDALPPEGPGEVYLADLPGCAVVTAAGVALGRVAAVDAYGAHPVLRVAPEEGGVERLIPLVPAYVTGVDLEARVIEVDWEADY
jgi:16S rRNA processing protein RimM